MYRKRQLAGSVAQLFSIPSERVDFLRNCLARGIDGELAAVLRLFAARFGDKAAFESLIEEIPAHSIEIASQSVSLFGYYPGRELGERAADLVRARVHTSIEAASFGHSATIGMLYIYEMDFGAPCVTQPRARHPGGWSWWRTGPSW